jgi:ribose 5-phosphate isomerase B
MNVFFAADHAGLRMKAVLAERVALMGHTVVDKGAYDLDPNDDYPDVVIPLREAVANTPDSFGIVCAGSGQGEAMCANRMSGIRAAVFYAPVSATEALDREGAHSEDGYDIVRLARKHNDANVLSIGARFVSVDEALEAVRIFLETPYSEEDRHTRRLNKFS